MKQSLPGERHEVEPTTSCWGWGGLPPLLAPGQGNQRPPPAKTCFPEPALLPPESPDEKGEKEVFLGDNETVNKISNAGLGNDYFTYSDS